MEGNSHWNKSPTEASQITFSDGIDHCTKIENNRNFALLLDIGIALAIAIVN